MKLKVGIWDNPDKLRKVFNKVATIYGVIITILGVVFGFITSWIIGGLIAVLSVPLWIIGFSYDSWKENKIEVKNENEN